MSKKIELVGKKFGRLTVLRENGRGGYGEALWECMCDCGNIKTVNGKHLRSGHTKSCGCLIVEKIIESRKTHGMHGTLTYKTWAGIKRRCNNPNEKAYKHYGGRGIHVCSRWNKFENFLLDMGLKPAGLTIERIDNDGDYCKENCSWESMTTQSRNKRLSKRNKTGFNGVSLRPDTNKYRASITTNGERIYLGSFSQIEDAASVRKNAERKYWGKEFK